MKGNSYLKPENTKPTMIDEITEWWEFLDLSEKFAVLWLILFGSALITLGIIFPIVGLVLLILGSVIGTIVALIHLFE